MSASHGDYFSNTLDDYLDIEKENIERITRQKQTKDKQASSSLIAKFKNQEVLNFDVSDHTDGDIRLERLRQTVRLVDTLESHQHVFIEAIIQSNLPNIYGRSFADNEIRIKQRNNIDNIRYWTSVICPRRWGKTFAISVFIAAALLTMKNVKIVVFSRALRQSIYLSNYVKQHLSHMKENGKHLGLDFTYSTNNKEEVFISTAFGDYNQLWALPSVEETTRGTTANIIICEEAAVIPMDFFGNVVIPMTVVQRTAVILITTIRSDNYINAIVDLKDDDGVPISNTLRFFGSCKACRNAGHAASCRHQLEDNPAWISEENKRVAQMIYSRINMDTLGAQEMAGELSSRFERFFDPNDIDYLFHKAKLFEDIHFTEEPGIIFVFIDPSGAGQSDTGITSIVFHGGTCIMVGAEVLRDQLIKRSALHIIDHCLALKKIPKLSKARIVMFIENNRLDHAIQLTSNLSGQIPNCEIVDKNGEDTTDSLLVETSTGNYRTGVYTGQEIKEKISYKMQSYLQKHALAIYSDFVCTKNPRPGSDKGVSEIIRDILKQQLSNWCLIKERGKTNFAKEKYGFTGKIGGSKDDLVISLMLNIFWAEAYYINKGKNSDMISVQNTSHFYDQAFVKKRKLSHQSSL